jgi:putative transcriptional regulator
VPIYIGGPVQTDRGFVLHPTGQTFQATVDLGDLSLHLPGRAVRHRRRRGREEPDHPRLRRLGSRPTGSRTGRQRLADLPVRPDILFNTSSELRLEAAAKHWGSTSAC